MIMNLGETEDGELPRVASCWQLARPLNIRLRLAVDKSPRQVEFILILSALGTCPLLDTTDMSTD